MSVEVNLICPKLMTLNKISEIIRSHWLGFYSSKTAEDNELQLWEDHSYVRIVEVKDSKSVLQEYKENSYFPQEIVDLISLDQRFFYILYNDYQLAKEVLMVLLNGTEMREEIWFESYFGWFVRAEKLFKEMRANEDLNWLTEEIPAELL